MPTVEARTRDRRDAYLFARRDDPRGQQGHSSDAFHCDDSALRHTPFRFPLEAPTRIACALPGRAGNSICVARSACNCRVYTANGAATLTGLTSSTCCRPRRVWCRNARLPSARGQPRDWNSGRGLFNRCDGNLRRGFTIHQYHVDGAIAATRTHSPGLKLLSGGSAGCGKSALAGVLSPGRVCVRTSLRPV